MAWHLAVSVNSVFALFFFFFFFLKKERKRRKERKRKVGLSSPFMLPLGNFYSKKLGPVSVPELVRCGYVGAATQSTGLLSCRGMSLLEDIGGDHGS